LTIKDRLRVLQGRTGDAPQTLESEGQMIQRVLPELMGMKNVFVINDEAHHCYREKPAADADFTDAQGNQLDGEDLKRRQSPRQKRQRSGARLDLWPRSGQTQPGCGARARSLRHAVFLGRIGLCRRHAVSMDDERFLADGRD